LEGGNELILFFCHASSCPRPAQEKFSFNESLNKIFADFRSTSVLRVFHVCRAFISLPSHLDVGTSRQFYGRGTQVEVNAVTHSCISYPITGLNRPLGLQEVEGSRISAQSVHEGGKVASLKDLPLSPAKRYSWYSFLLVAGSTPGPQCSRED
jgi:hypothetical protein